MAAVNGTASTPAAAAAAEAAADAGLARFAGFFDDAAVFPPGLAALPDAVHDHLTRRGTPLGELAGPLLLTGGDVVRATQFARRQAERADIDLQADPVRIGLIVAPDGLDAAARLAADPPDGVVICGLEVKTDTRWREQSAAAVEIAEEAPYSVHVELSADAVNVGGIAELRGTRVRLKFRTGGLRARLFPTVDELAAVVHGAVAQGVAFKLTAGLHQAVRQVRASDGFAHHGFLNIALAAAWAQSGGQPADAARALAVRDPAELVACYRGIAAGWRTAFESFGTCGILEPVESLVRLGLLGGALLPAGQGGHR